MTHMSDNGNLTLDELVKSLLIHPLSGIDDQVQVIWDIDEPSILELFLSEDTEDDDEENETTNAIKKDIADLIKRQSVRRGDVAELIKKESLKRADETETKEILMMSPEEILERIKCKCRELKDKRKKKSSIIASTTTSSIKDGSKEALSKAASKSSRLSKKSRIRTDVTVEEQQINCKQFLSIKEYAIFFIDDLLLEAEGKVNGTDDNSKHSTTIQSECIELEKFSSTDLGSSQELSVYSSLKINEFTPQYGHDFIMDTVLTWNLNKPWTYCVDFISENSDTCTDFYNYEVKWSLPTMSYPIPQVTASVYFTIEVSRVRGPECPVNVFYNFETERYKFHLEDDIQHEVFLDSIIKNKLEFFKSLRF